VPTADGPALLTPTTDGERNRPERRGRSTLHSVPNCLLFASVAVTSPRRKISSASFQYVQLATSNRVLAVARSTNSVLHSGDGREETKRIALFLLFTVRKKKVSPCLVSKKIRISLL